VSCEQDTCPHVSCPTRRVHDTEGGLDISCYLSNMEYLRATIVTPTKKLGLPRKDSRKEDQTLIETQGKNSVEEEKEYEGEQ
jgi:hypothetical protein